MATIDDGMAGTLAALTARLAVLERDWWLIGSAAMALHGAAPITVADVDLLVDPADAPRLLAVLGIEAVASASDRFRSAIFARWTGAALPVEIMAGFEVRSPSGWVTVRPQTRVAITAGGGRWFVPSVPELRAIGRLYGRPKDAERDRLLASIDPTDR